MVDGRATGRRQLLINASELLRQPGAVRRLTTSVPLGDIDVADERISGDVAVDVTLSSSLDDIEVAGTLAVPWSDRCRRCLRPLAASLEIDVHERYVREPAAPGRTAGPEEFAIENGQIDLAPMVREEVLLGIPDAPLCRDDCAGICPQCGADRNERPCDCDTDVRDERWAVLDQLRTDELETGEPT